MPRFRITIRAKSDPANPMKDIVRGIIKTKLSPLKVKTTAYERTSYQGNLPYAVVYADFIDDQVNGLKDWRAEKLPEILDEFKACGVEPLDFSLAWHSSASKEFPPLMEIRVDEKAVVNF